MALPYITMTGNLVAEPRLRFTNSGAQVVTFRIACTERVPDRQNPNGGFKDGDSCFLDVEVWRNQAENIVETLTKGMQVTVSGHLRTREYQTTEGERRSVYEVKGIDVAVSLQRQVAEVRKASGAPAGAPAAAPAAAQAGPPVPAGAGTGGGGRMLDEPPF